MPWQGIFITATEKELTWLVKIKKKNPTDKKIKTIRKSETIYSYSYQKVHNLIICKRKQKKVIALKGISKAQKENAEGITNGIQEVDFICVESGVSVTMSWQD